MERPTTRPELVEELKDVLAVERLALERYEADIGTFRNFEITKTLQDICADERRHIRMLDDLIRVLSA